MESQENISSLTDPANRERRAEPGSPAESPDKIGRNPRSPGPDDDEDQDNEDQDQNDQDKDNSGPKALAEELKVEDLSRCIYFKDNKLFAAAGPGIPLLQMGADGTFLSLDPNKPYRPDVDEELTVEVDEHGRLLDPLGQVRKLTGMKFRGKQLYYLARRHPDTEQHLAAWFDESWQPHFLYLGETILSAPMILRIRSRMIDGELSSFEEISSD